MILSCKLKSILASLSKRLLKRGLNIRAAFSHSINCAREMRSRSTFFSVNDCVATMGRVNWVGVMLLGSADKDGS